MRPLWDIETTMTFGRVRKLPLLKRKQIKIYTMKLKITVTKDILKRSMMCGKPTEAWSAENAPNKNCAIALAIRDIFPNAEVHRQQILILTKPHSTIKLPSEAVSFIDLFDGLRNTPEERLDLPEFSFEIDLPQEVIDSINISELTESLKNHETLELIEA